MLGTDFVEQEVQLEADTYDLTLFYAGGTDRDGDGIEEAEGFFRIFVDDEPDLRALGRGGAGLHARLPGSMSVSRYVVRLRCAATLNICVRRSIATTRSPRCSRRTSGSMFRE